MVTSVVEDFTPLISAKKVGWEKNNKNGLFRLTSNKKSLPHFSFSLSSCINRSDNFVFLLCFHFIKLIRILFLRTLCC